MKSVLILVTIALALAFSAQLSSQPPQQQPNWDRAMALEAIDRNSATASLKPLYQLARAGDDEPLLRALTGIADDDSLSDPQRDYLLFSFTTNLGDLDHGAVGTQVMSFLSAYRSKTLVAHEDHPAYAVPLFNVSAAAHGVSNHWHRQGSAAKAERLAGESPEKFISAYLEANAPGRLGFADGLASASPEQSAKLGELMVPMLATATELTLITVQAALQSGDEALLRQSIGLGRDADMAKAFAMVSTALDDEQSVDLLGHVLQQESAVKSALAVAQLSPSRLDAPEVQEMLFTMLSHPELGSSAALVLGSSSDPEILGRLDAIASGGDGLEKQRAALARSVEIDARGSEL